MPIYKQIPPSLKSPPQAQCTDTQSICPSIFLPAAPRRTGSNENPFYLSIFVVPIHCALVCVCASISVLLFMIYHKGHVITRQSKGKREQETITKNEEGGDSTDIVIIAHLVHFPSLPLSFQ